MKILFLDTASFFVNIAIIDGDKIIHHQEKNDHKLSERIFFMLEKVFADANIKPIMIDKIYVTNGPGSFTGIRVGLSIAKTFAWQQQIPICALSTFAFYASGYQKDLIISLPDKNGWGYMGYYGSDLAKKAEEYTKIEDFLGKYPQVKHVNLQAEKEPSIDFYKMQKIFAEKEDKVHAIAPNYLKNLGYQKMTGDQNE